MKSPQRILVPIDMSVFSITALQYAEDVAEHFGAEIAVVHVVEHETQSAKAAEADSEAEAEQALRSTIARMLLDHNVVHQSLRIELRHGSPAQEIVKASQEIHADLIIMCTHGRSGLSHVLMGSVAERVVRRSPCPVLTIKPDEFSELINVTEEDISEGLHLE